MKLNKLNTGDPSFADDFAEVKSKKSLIISKEVKQLVAEIIEDIESRGEAALVELINKYDSIECAKIEDITLGKDDFARAFETLDSIDTGMRQHLEQAKNNILSYHSQQIEKSWQLESDEGSSSSISSGISYAQKIVPLESVGIYVPGGQAAYPSSVLMGAVPAELAGVDHIYVLSPISNTDRDYLPSQMILAACHLSGVEKLYRLGGAQAVAAAASGNAGIAKMDKLVGPGNVYVTEAKRQVFGKLGIESLAGPTELVVVADKTSPPSWLAADIFAQAEHAKDAFVALFCCDQNVLEQTIEILDTKLEEQERAQIISAALSNNGIFVKTKDTTESISLADSLAAEHLQIMCDDADKYKDQIRFSAGVFLGVDSSTVHGDYGAGPNHVLPTGGGARFSSPLGVYDFIKRISFLRLAQNHPFAETCAALAQTEGLAAHAEAARIRTKGKGEAPKKIKGN